MTINESRPHRSRVVIAGVLVLVAALAEWHSEYRRYRR